MAELSNRDYSLKVLLFHNTLDQRGFGLKVNKLLDLQWLVH